MNPGDAFDPWLGAVECVEDGCLREVRAALRGESRELRLLRLAREFVHETATMDAGDEVLHPHATDARRLLGHIDRLLGIV